MKGKETQTKKTGQVSSRWIEMGGGGMNRLQHLLSHKHLSGSAAPQPLMFYSSSVQSAFFFLMSGVLIAVRGTTSRDTGSSTCDTELLVLI